MMSLLESVEERIRQLKTLIASREQASRNELRLLNKDLEEMELLLERLQNSKAFIMDLETFGVDLKLNK